MLMYLSTSNADSNLILMPHKRERAREGCVRGRGVGGGHKSNHDGECQPAYTQTPRRDRLPAGPRTRAQAGGEASLPQAIEGGTGALATRPGMSRLDSSR